MIKGFRDNSNISTVSSPEMLPDLMHPVGSEGDVRELCIIIFVRVGFEAQSQIYTFMMIYRSHIAKMKNLLL